MRQPAPVRQQMAQGGGKYLPPMRDIMNAPKPPPFRPAGELAQQTPRPPAEREAVVVRGQEPAAKEPLAPPRLAADVQIPTREELGLLTSARSSNEAEPDWNTVRQQLESWQATFYRLEKTADGQYRFICALPYASTAGKLRQFEATAATEGSAMQAVLNQANLWRQSQQ